MTWNVARRSSRLAEQAAALASRDPDVVALQEVTSDAAALAGGAGADRASPRPRIAGCRRPLPRPAVARVAPACCWDRAPRCRGPSATLPVPWAETALAALADAAIGPVEIHCLHVPNAANGWVKAHTLQAIRAGLQLAPRMARVVCGDLNTPRRELESGEVMSFARDSRGRLRPERGPAWDEAELGVVPGLRDLGYLGGAGGARPITRHRTVRVGAG